MRIPNSFYLLGQKITVEQDSNLTFEADAKGISLFREGKIVLQRREQYSPQSQVEQTFCHELVHWILHQMGEGELGGNEKFVDVFGSLLHQALSTATFKATKSQKGK